MEGGIIAPSGRFARLETVGQLRWVQRYAPEVNRRLRSRLKPTNDSWRVDETYVRVKGKWRYLYRAVDSSGATLHRLTDLAQGLHLLHRAWSARVCACSSVNMRTFSMAITAWSAKVVTSSICRSVKGSTRPRARVTTPITVPFRCRGTPNIVRTLIDLLSRLDFVVGIGQGVGNMHGLFSSATLPTSLPRLG